MLRRYKSAQSIMQPKQLGFLSGDDEKRDYEHMKARVLEEIKKIFKPEFLNRIDETIVFHSLTREDMKKILSIQMNLLQKRCADQMALDLRLTPAAQRELINSSFDVKYGARPLKRALQTLIEDPLSEKILTGEIRNGDHVRISWKKNGFVFETGRG